MPERLCKQFNKLQKTGPSPEWTANTRNFLINRVKQDTLGNEPSWAFSFRLNSMVWVKRVMPSPVKVVSFFIVIGLVGGTNMVAQAEYIPKRPLYTVKRTFEKIELVMALTAKSETKVNLKHATKRKEEAVKLAKKEDFAPGEKTENINTVVKSLEQNISAANNSLEIVKESEKDHQGTVELAKEFTKNISDNIEDLNEVKEASKEVKEAVEEAVEEMEKAEESSIQILIDEVENKPALPEEGEEIIYEVISEEEVKEILNNKIERTDKNLKEIEEEIEVPSQEQEPLLPEETVENIDSEETVAIQEVKENSEEAQVKVEEVKVLINDGMLSEALEKIQETNKINEESKETIAKIEDVSDQEIDIEAVSEDGVHIFDEEGSVEGVIEFGEGINENTPEIIEFNIDSVNYAPLGGEIIQSATQTPEIGTSSINYLYLGENPAIIEETEE